MVNAIYQSTKDVGLEPTRKGVAIVDVDGVALEVEYWPSLIDQWGADGAIAYVEAEALWEKGHYADARAKAENIPTVNGVAYGQQWADEHPDPPQGLG